MMRTKALSIIFLTSFASVVNSTKTVRNRIEEIQFQRERNRVNKCTLCVCVCARCEVSFTIYRTIVHFSLISGNSKWCNFLREWALLKLTNTHSRRKRPKAFLIHLLSKMSYRTYQFIPSLQSLFPTSNKQVLENINQANVENMYIHNHISPHKSAST